MSCFSSLHTLFPLPATHPPAFCLANSCLSSKTHIRCHVPSETFLRASRRLSLPLPLHSHPHVLLEALSTCPGAAHVCRRALATRAKRLLSSSPVDV